MWHKTVCLCVLIVFTATSCCEAQSLFGERTLGRSLGKRSSLRAAAAAPGSLDGGRRFLRDERSVSDFVGNTTGGGGAAGFVGGMSAVTTATSSVAGLGEIARPSVNRPRFVRPAGLYPERLQVSETLTFEADPNLDGSPLSESLQSFIQSHSMTIEVSEADHSAIVRGVVPSEHDRRTTELLVMFEPGIQTVANQLIVDPGLPPWPRRLRFPESQKVPTE